MINIINIGKVIFYEYFYFCFILNLRDFGDLCMLVLVLYIFNFWVDIVIFVDFIIFWLVFN